jgi:hypothetical protein
MDIDRSRDIVNLAHEGVPQRAIARALELPAAAVAATVADAVARGSLIEPPGNDWPAQESRARRQPVFLGPPADEGALLMAAAQKFGLTKGQAVIFLALIRRKFCPTKILHDIIEAQRDVNSTPTDRKIVSVMICNIRKRLRGRFVIQTVQGSG